jgi:hypothetical protein
VKAITVGSRCSSGSFLANRQSSVRSSCSQKPLLVRFVFSFALTLLLSGCGKKTFDTQQIHAITEELVATTQQVAGPKTEVAIRPETTPGNAKNAGPVRDHIRITLHDSALRNPLEQTLARAAKKHDLSITALSSSEGSTEFLLTHNSQITHVIQIVVEQITQTEIPKTAIPQNLGRGPKLAIIVDDLGHDLSVAEKLLSLPYPLTISVIPNLPDSAKVAEAAYKRGDQVLLHLPMEAGETAKAEPVELRVGMQRGQVENILDETLKSVPHVAGVNNHQGSHATADLQLMDALMGSLRQRGLFFIDSRTSVQTVAFDTAEKDGVRAAFRNAQFLDDIEKSAAIQKQLERAENDAIKKGWAITIGHPHPATIEVLRQNLPRLRSRGIQLVFASDVVK